MSVPLVTVYITNYNYEHYIRHSIDSVLAQTFQDFEIIIIDDGSTDNSKAIIEEYKDNDKIRVIYQQNKGLNKTNNVAIANARGKYLIRLDADDYFNKAALGIMTSLMEADPELGLVFPDYYYIDQSGKITGQERRHHFDDEVTLYDQPAHGACTMVRLEFLKALGGYDEEFSCQDGYELWLKMTFFHRVTNVSKPLFYYRRHDSNLTNNEGRILSTRKRIKAKFTYQYLSPFQSVAIIPIRRKKFGKQYWDACMQNGKTILDHKIEQCLEVKSISTIVVTSSDQELMEIVEKKYVDTPNVVALQRPREYEVRPVSLYPTIQMVLDRVEKQIGKKLDGVLTVSLDYPFVNSSTIDEVIHTLTIFKSDSVISVRSDNSTYYNHTGKTLKPILSQGEYTRYEREALFKGVGGIVASTTSSFRKNKSMVSDRIAHVMLEEKDAFEVSSHFDFKLFQALANNNTSPR